MIHDFFEIKKGIFMECQDVESAARQWETFNTERSVEWLRALVRVYGLRTLCSWQQTSKFHAAEFLQLEQAIQDLNRGKIHNGPYNPNYFDAEIIPHLTLKGRWRLLSMKLNRKFKVSLPGGGLDVRRFVN